MLDLMAPMPALTARRLAWIAFRVGRLVLERVIELLLDGVESVADALLGIVDSAEHALELQHLPADLLQQRGGRRAGGAARMGGSYVLI